eukprot:16433550-Heterocapsa_arctica.AAC.5
MALHVRGTLAGRVPEEIPTLRVILPKMQTNPSTVAGGSVVEDVFVVIRRRRFIANLSLNDSFVPSFMLLRVSLSRHESPRAGAFNLGQSPNIIGSARYFLIINAGVSPVGGGLDGVGSRPPFPLLEGVGGLQLGSGCCARVGESLRPFPRSLTQEFCFHYLALIEDFSLGGLDVFAKFLPVNILFCLSNKRARALGFGVGKGYSVFPSDPKVCVPASGGSPSSLEDLICLVDHSFVIRNDGDTSNETLCDVDNGMQFRTVFPNQIPYAASVDVKASSGQLCGASQESRIHRRGRPWFVLGFGQREQAAFPQASGFIVGSGSEVGKVSLSRRVPNVIPSRTLPPSLDWCLLATLSQSFAMGAFPRLGAFSSEFGFPGGWPRAP